MLTFDFRNGPLRRKFDGLKYALKNIEDIAFELSLQGPQENILFADEPVAKKSKLVNDADSTLTVIEDSLVDVLEFKEINLRLTEFDQHRELVIKDSRDVQKLAKQGIFAVVRGQLGDAEQKLSQAKSIADRIMIIISKVC
jgi:hypothetical protein